MLIPTHLTTFLHVSPVDFRKSINGLSAIVIDCMQLELTSGQLYLFRNKRGDRMKALHYEHNCFTLIYCRLEKGKWVFPRSESSHFELTQQHVEWLLSSHQFSKAEGMKAADYTEFS